MPILPGDPYFGRVMVYGNKLWVEKFHDGGCPIDPDEDRRERETETTQTLSEAA